MIKPKIKEVIIVEGKDDVSAVRKAVDADIIITNGLGITKTTLAEVETVSKRQGVIILTDPDFPGEKIRKIISQHGENCKQAYIRKEDAKCPKTGKVGVEYASPEVILAAIKGARGEVREQEIEYTLSDLVVIGLVGLPNSGQLRDKLCAHLGIGKTNGKQLVKKLNSYQISPAELLEFVEANSEGSL